MRQDWYCYFEYGNVTVAFQFKDGHWHADVIDNQPDDVVKLFSGPAYLDDFEIGPTLNDAMVLKRMYAPSR